MLGYRQEMVFGINPMNKFGLLGIGHFLDMNLIYTFKPYNVMKGKNKKMRINMNEQINIKTNLMFFSLNTISLADLTVSA